MKRRTALMMTGLGSLSLTMPFFQQAMARAPHMPSSPIPTAFHLPSHPPVPSAVTAPLSAVPELRSGEFAGIPAWLIDTVHASAAISILGGHVLSFVPKGGRDVFWLSPSRHPLPAPIRGGVPVCWPYFARQGQRAQMPAHGLVRTLPWELHAAQSDADGALNLTLAPPVLAGLPLRLSMQLHLGRQFSQALISENISPQPVIFTQALHNYLHVSHALQVDVSGLDGCMYLDKLDEGREYRQHGAWNLRDPRDPGRSDRIYTHTRGHYGVHDAGFSRRILMTTEGSQSAVLWNPGEIAAQQIADIGVGWRDYIALEASNAGPDMVVLPAGRQHLLRQTIAVQPH